MKTKFSHRLQWRVCINIARILERLHGYGQDIYSSSLSTLKADSTCRKDSFRLISERAIDPDWSRHHSKYFRPLWDHCAASPLIAHESSVWSRCMNLLFRWSCLITYLIEADDVQIMKQQIDDDEDGQVLQTTLDDFVA